MNADNLLARSYAADAPCIPCSEGVQRQDLGVNACVWMRGVIRDTHTCGVCCALPPLAQPPHLPRQEVVVRVVQLGGGRRSSGAPRIPQVQGGDEGVAVAQGDVVVCHGAQRPPPAQAREVPGRWDDTFGGRKSARARTHVLGRQPVARTLSSSPVRSSVLEMGSKHTSV